MDNLFKVQGHSKLRSRFWYVHEVILALDTGRERIDSGSDIGNRHGA